jgi:2-polyprenyl-6-methoxyphenol hydroxylase-like FAD-dependent oxidoreductase
MTAEQPKIVIIGAGLGGLLLALALEKHVGVKAEVYEQAPEFSNATDCNCL